MRALQVQLLAVELIRFGMACLMIANSKLNAICVLGGFQEYLANCHCYFPVQPKSRSCVSGLINFIIYSRCFDF